MTKTERLLEKIDTYKPIVQPILHTTDAQRETFINFMKHESGIEAENLIPEKLSRTEKKAFIDYTSIENTARAWEFILSAPRNTRIDTYQIRDLHKMLCNNTENYMGGLYRLSDSYALRRQSPNYARILYKMDDIQYKLSDAYPSNIHPVLRAIEVHSDLIETQPFNDFNKRTARLIMNWFLIKNGYTPIIFDAPTDKAEYMESIRANLDGDTEKYTKYMLESMLRTQRDIITVIRNNTNPFAR